VLGNDLLELPDGTRLGWVTTRILAGREGIELAP
jgi:hypothetical protein